MKYLTIIIITLLISACNSTKKAVQNTPKKTSKPIVEVVKPEVIEYEIETKDEVETEAVVEVEKDTIIQIQTPPKPPTPIEKLETTTEIFNHNRWNTILQQHVSKNGNVAYTSIKKNRTELDLYIDSLGQNMPTNDWSKEDKLAYWINAYNALTIDLILRNYPVKSIKDIKEPWDQRLWKIGEKWYNLNEIEHQILRKMDEPRIHFAIVCASFSCPKLQNEAFTASNMEAQLTNATKEFLSDPNRNNITANTLNISKIFKWFSKDFKTSGSISDFINTYTDINILNTAKTSYKDYNWDLND